MSDKKESASSRCTEFVDQKNTTRRSIDRRSALKALGIGVVGTVGTASFPVVDVATASHNEPYDDPIYEVIYNNDTEFAEIHSAVDGPKVVDNNRSTINMSAAVPIGFNDDIYMAPTRAQNVDVTVETVWNPADDTGHHFKEIEPHVQGDSDDSHSHWMESVIDFAWDVVEWKVNKPLPVDLLLKIADNESTIDVSTGDGEFNIHYDYLSDTEKGVGANWTVDFWTHDGSTPEGYWYWDFSVEGEVAYWSDSTWNPGWNVVDDFYHEHRITVHITDT